MMHDFSDIFHIQQLLARFANCFDLKDWAGLQNCLCDSIYTDYSDLRGTPPEIMSPAKFADMRRSALHELQTHHLGTNTEIDVNGDEANAKVSMVIYRKNASGETLHTHCLYQFGLSRQSEGWRISRIVQKVFWSDGNKTIHSGITHSESKPAVQ
ncbi:nuclear transport factor 2 family protein [Undibacterium jejuense]|uniref:Nuclear transport factor 2 family protein n=1 Tax=Undibacterium jejuense TaxID=1344949 RepID=A0A923KKW8_9BURK|nr:nuclear transport factor 2 family protein [Undibacterium jejuense]MBC3862365.1 nuclear transport factor 2 family protein [Undibacterium jejuense]